MSLALGDADAEILRRIERLPEKEKAEIVRRLEAKASGTRQVWFCQKGRSCDGEPHDGAEYKHARGDQWPPVGANWDIWFYMSGRGVGKTRAGSNWSRQMTKRTGRIALVGRRGMDVRQTMVESDSGLIRACELAGETYEWKPALKEFTFENGAKAFGFSAEEPESLRGPEHGAAWMDEPCVAEGELVLLERGLVPIEQVRVGDRAWTRQGFKRVSAVYDNGVKDTHWVHAEGRRVRVTANHRLATDAQNWLRCDQLSYGSTLVACSHMALPPGSSGADAAITATRRGTIATAEAGSSTATSTKRRSGRSRRASSSITGTKTRRTTSGQISKRSPRQGTTASLSAPSPLAESMSSRIRTLPTGVRGVEQRWKRSGTSANLALTLVSGAETTSKAEPPTPPTAAFPTESVLVGSVSRAGRARVYDLTVEGAHEFVAGGIVVHNCHMDLIEEVWSNLNLGLRQQGLPGGAKVLLTSSPLPTQWTKDRIKENGTVLVQVPTSVNLHNLDEGYKRRVVDPLRGTRKGKQELDAMLLEDVEGALWEADWLSREEFDREDMDRVVVAIDPAGSDSKTADMTGLVVAGRNGDRYGVFEDATDRYTPNGWANKAIKLYDKYQADAIVLERYGGATATAVLRNAKFKGRIIEVKARVGKATRAEPISGLYEQRMVDHLTGAELADLEDQMLTWVPGLTKKSPDRVDALVWALSDLSKRRTTAGSLGVASGSLRPQKPRGPGSAYRRKNWNR